MAFPARAFGPEVVPPSAERFELEQILIDAFEGWWRAKDGEAVERWFDPEAVVINYCPQHLSRVGGELRGRAEILLAVKLFRADFEASDPCVRSILMDGRHLVVTYSVRLRNVGTGRSGLVAGMAHLTLGSDLRVIQLENAFDTAAMAEIGDMLETFAARSEALDRSRCFFRPM